MTAVAPARQTPHAPEPRDGPLRNPRPLSGFARPPKDTAPVMNEPSTPIRPGGGLSCSVCGGDGTDPDQRSGSERPGADCPVCDGTGEVIDPSSLDPADYCPFGGWGCA